MDRLVIKGGFPLKGSIAVSGAKNAALPILFAAVLSDEKCTFSNVPLLADIRTTVKILEQVGVVTEWDQNKKVLTTNAANITSFEAPYELVRTMRASVLILGPLLARFGEARVSLPGGCSIGARPVNLHLMALEKMGAKIEVENGYISASAKKLKGAVIHFPIISVGATENTVMAATLAEGVTTLENAALEPEIVDLCNFLISCGVKIEGVGTSVLKVHGAQGRSALRGCSHKIIADRIEAGTYLAATAAAGGEITLNDINPQFLGAVLEKLRETGCEISTTVNSITIKAPSAPDGLRAVDVTTKEFPGFPTDMQAQLMAAMCVAKGRSVFSENIFENRFMHVPELMRLGADIAIQGSTAVTTGKGRLGLSGAIVMATDLRASASLVIAALASRGETVVRRVYHLDRGYEDMERKLSSLGAQIKREKEAE